MYWMWSLCVIWTIIWITFFQCSMYGEAEIIQRYSIIYKHWFLHALSKLLAQQSFLTYIRTEWIHITIIGEGSRGTINWRTVLNTHRIKCRMYSRIGFIHESVVNFVQCQQKDPSLQIIGDHRLWNGCRSASTFCQTSFIHTRICAIVKRRLKQIALGSCESHAVITAPIWFKRYGEQPHATQPTDKC